MLIARSALRFDNPDGSSKDWTIELYDDGTVTRLFGSTGKKMRSTTAPPSVTAPSAKEWYQERIREKVRKGYYPIKISTQDQKDVAKIVGEKRKQEAHVRMNKLLENVSDSGMGDSEFVLF